MRPQILLLLLCFAVTTSAWTAEDNWTAVQFNQTLKDSGRTGQVSSEDFKQIQVQKENALAQIKEYLSAKFKKADDAVIKAFSEVPREYFHYNYEKNYLFATKAYEVPAHPWAVGYGSALSDYLGQAYMTQLAGVKPEDTVLEIGTGSGYQIAVMSRMAKEVYSIEIIKPLGENVEKIFEPIKYGNVHVRTGDGFFGWVEVAGGFDVIIVTCAARFVPPALLEQLKPGGRLIIPVGQPYKRGQFLYVYRKDSDGKVHSRKDMGVYFVPMKGAISSQPEPEKK